MKNKTGNISIFLFLFVSLTGAFFASPVSADANSLIVEFENTPLFSEANFLPGNSVARFIKVTNNTTETKSIAIESINVSDSDSLGDVLNIKITEGATELFNNTLSNFFGAGETFLSDLPGNGTQTQYDVTVSFQSGADDPFQEKSLSFDVLIGFQGEEEVVGPTSSGGGGSLGTTGDRVPGLVIKDETVKVISIEETSVTVEWETSHFSTSQVIYGSTGEAHTLDLSDNAGSPPAYGYAHTTAEFDTSPRATSHSVLVTGLTPGTTYFFRAVSHASPPTITREYTFATLSLGETGGGVDDGVGEGISDTGGELPKVAGEPFSAEGGPASGGDSPSNSSGQAAQGEEETSSRRGPNAFVAGVGLFDTPFLLAVALAILLLLFFLFFRKRKKEQDRR